MIKLILFILFLYFAVILALAATSGNNSRTHHCSVNAPMEQSQCRAVGKPLVARKVFDEQND